MFFIYTAFCTFTFGGYAQPYWEMLVSSINIFSLLSRLPQIYKNHQAKSTGTLSFANYFLNTAGCLARIFTLFKETGDMQLIFISSNALITNIIIVLQIIIYWKNSSASKGHGHGHGAQKTEAVSTAKPDSKKKKKLE